LLARFINAPAVQRLITLRSGLSHLNRAAEFLSFGQVSYVSLRTIVLMVNNKPKRNSMPDQEYFKIVDQVEAPLASYAKRSFEAFSSTFLDGGDYFQHYADLWADPDHRPRIATRSPLQIERDRVLYSSGMRKLTEKYHVLYSGDRRITRNFTTHTMRMAQVARAISQGLQLNADFAEALALGAKVGAPPFVHASKFVVAKWISQRILELDEEAKAHTSSSGSPQKSLFGDIKSPLPIWLAKIESPKIADAVRRYIPWAVGVDIKAPYSSGSQGYWSLAADPYLVKSRPKRFSPETMFGIWMHSLGLHFGPQTFMHQFQIEGATSGQHEIRWDHVTYESLVVRYADDITWVIENLDDAHKASVLSAGSDMYYEILDDLREHGKVPTALNDAIFERDTGGLYNYFITDFIKTSREVFERLGDSANFRLSLREGSGEAVISLSPEVEAQLARMKSFLERRVFSEPRVFNRSQILGTLTEACLDLLYKAETLQAYVKTQAAVLNIKGEKLDRAESLLSEPVHRVQLVVDIFSQMSDQEIYDFVGIQGL
jgi:dGTP triphosphohydrolase